MGKRLTHIITRFAIAIACVLAFGELFKLYTDSQLSAEQQAKVLIKAIPFVAVFVSIVLAFVLVIVLVAVAFGGRVPQRAYRPIEWITIAGILLGVVGMFQGWKLFTYEFGFLLLLASVLSFMVWSHLTPMSLRAGRALPPLGRRAHLAGLVAAIVVWAIVVAATANAANPKEPYGVGATLWAYKTDEEKAQIADEMEHEYNTAKLPVLLLISLLPAGLFYFGVRELFASHPDAPEQTEREPLPPTVEGAMRSGAGPS